MLLEHHERMLREASIEPAIWTQRGYKSMAVDDEPEMAEIGFGPLARGWDQFPGLLIPAWSLCSMRVWGYQYRPDKVRYDRRGRPVKYENPRNQEMRLDVAPTSQEMLEDAEFPLVVTEGAKKADCVLSDDHGFIPINLLGVGIWKTPGCMDEWDAVRDYGRREVFIAFDSDAVTKPEVQQQEIRLALYMKYRFGSARLMRIPAGPGGEKWGLDDYLSAGFSMDHLVRTSFDLED